MLFCPFISTQSKNRHLEPRLCPEHCTSCPGAHSPCLCVRLHVVFRQPKELRSIEKPSSLLPLGLSRVLLGAGGGGGWHKVFRLSTVPRCPSDLSLFLRAYFPLFRGFGLRVGIQLITPPLPPPLPTPPQSHTAACATLIHWCRYKQRFLSSNFSSAARGWCGGYWC